MSQAEAVPARPDITTKLVGAIVVLALGILNFLSLRESSAANDGNTLILQRITRLETQMEWVMQAIQAKGGG